MVSQESQSSAFWFRRGWGSQHIVTIFHLGGGFLVSAGLEDMHHIIMYIP